MKIVWLQGIYMQIMSNNVTFKKYLFPKMCLWRSKKNTERQKIKLINIDIWILHKIYYNLVYSVSGHQIGINFPKRGKQRMD